MKRVTDIVTKNLGLKILATALAVLIWLLIVNIEDPERTKAYTTQVNIEHSGYLTKQGKTYEVLDNSDRVTFTVSGHRSVIEQMGSDDFTATADLRDITSDDRVLIHITANRYSHSLKFVNREQYLELKVEQADSITLPVKVRTIGTPADGCYIRKTSCSPAGVTVTGPASEISDIQYAEVEADVSGVTESFTDTAKVVLRDSSGKRVSQSNLKLKKSRIRYKISVAMRKTVKLNIRTSGKPADGYRIKAVDASQSQTVLVGTSSVMEQLSQLTIDSSQLNVSGRTKSYTCSLNLEDYLPDNVSLAEGQKKTVKVKIRIVKT